MCKGVFPAGRVNSANVRARYYNNTQYAGLENHIVNSYANSLLQVMHYTPLLRNLALQHAATACLASPCVLCELGYVFDMLQKAEGSTCQATNMFKAMSSSPQGKGDLFPFVFCCATPLLVRFGRTRLTCSRQRARLASLKRRVVLHP